MLQEKSMGGICAVQDLLTLGRQRTKGRIRLELAKTYEIQERLERPSAALISGNRYFG